MYVYTKLKPRNIILIFWAILFYLPTVYASQKPAEWGRAQSDVNSTLMQEGASIAELANEVNATSPKNAQDALFKICVLMRAGMNNETIVALKELKELNPEARNLPIYKIYDYACKELSAWEVAKATVEIFAETFYDIRLEYCLYGNLLNSGWTVERIDEWLADLSEGPFNRWGKERLRFQIRYGWGDDVIYELSDSVRQNPEDIKGMIEFLEMVTYARKNTDTKDWDLSWMTEIIKPKKATEAEKIASYLRQLSNVEPAVAFFRQAMDTPLTDKELRGLGMRISIFVSPEKIRAMFEARVRESLSGCLLRLGNDEEAQALMEEAVQIRKEHNLDSNMGFAGSVQRASGERVIEKQIKGEEQESENDPEYWQKRARYYMGRREPALEGEAILKGFELAKNPQLEFERKSHWRGRFFVDYIDLLKREKRLDEANEFIIKEIREAPVNSWSSNKAVCLFIGNFGREIKHDDSLLWNWLKRQTECGTGTERLLKLLMKKARPLYFEEYLTRIEKMELGKQLCTKKTMSSILHSSGYHERAIKLLRNLCDNYQDDETRSYVQLKLFEIYLYTGDWKKAEDLFPEVSKSLFFREIHEWHTNVAIAAAKSGAKTDAMRIWCQVANMSPSYIDGLEELVNAGLKNELKEFYLQMQKEIPTSEFPAKALKVLEE